MELHFLHHLSCWYGYSMKTINFLPQGSEKCFEDLVLSSDIPFFWFSWTGRKYISQSAILTTLALTLCEKRPNSELFLVCISLYSGFNPSVFSPNTLKNGPEITPYLDTFHTVLGSSEMLHLITIPDKLFGTK